MNYLQPIKDRGGGFGGGEEQKPAEFGQAAGVPEWGMLDEERRTVWEATGYVPPIAGGAPNTSEESGHADERPEPYYSGRYLDMKGMDWTKDLSSNGQWLFRELLVGAENIELLKQFAQDDGADLDAATAELEQHGLIDKSDPGYFHLPYKKIPSSGEGE